jgi:Aspartate/tyrosine/aromatic aminotransferase
MDIVPALLEQWMRQYYFDTEIDIGSSGVASYSMSELRKLLDLSQDELDQVTFDDSRTLGGPGLREAIGDRWANCNPDRVMATHGSSEGIFLAMNALLRPGDEVVTVSPCYQQLSAIAESMGCRLRHWGLDFEQGFVADVDRLKSLITRQTRMLVVNFPQNPTGASLTPGQLKDLVNVVAEAGSYLVWDGAFAEMTHDLPPLPDPGTWYDRTITLGTLSKGYGLPGLRVGWCIAAPDILERFVSLRDYITLHLSPLIELIAERAVRNAHVLLRFRMEQARANLNSLGAWVERHREFVDWAPPRGGVCAFLRMPGGDVEAFCHRFAREYRVLLVPGTCFDSPGFVRLGFGGPGPKFEEGLSRLSDLLVKFPW